MPEMPEVVLWISLALLTYTYVGYPMLIHLLARIAPQRPSPLSAETVPDITSVISAHNEQPRIATRLRNLLAAEYPTDKLSIIVVDDASTDQTVTEVATVDDSRIQVLQNHRQRGKAACLNQALRNVKTGIVVFADARQSFEPEAIQRLAAHFADPRVGAVSGALVLVPSSSGVGKSVGLYWRLERKLRRDESLWDSAIGCTGAIYAIRAKLFREIPEDTILDDVVIPMTVLLQGYRVSYDRHAIANEPQEVASRIESARKRRTLAGNFQMMFRYPSWLLPWKNRAWWQLLSHKYLRVIAPLLFASALVTNIALRDAPGYQCLLGLQLLFYAVAVIGLVAPRAAPWLTAVPTGIVFLNLTVVQGFWHYLRGTYSRGWKRG